MSGKCKDCKFWQVYESNKGLGMCCGVGVMKAGFKLDDPATVAVTYIDPNSIAQNPPISDYIVRTLADFGCVSHKPSEQGDNNGKE